MSFFGSLHSSQPLPVSIHDYLAVAYLLSIRRQSTFILRSHISSRCVDTHPSILRPTSNTRSLHSRMLFFSLPTYSVPLDALLVRHTRHHFFRLTDPSASWPCSRLHVAAQFHEPWASINYIPPTRSFRHCLYPNCGMRCTDNAGNNTQQHTFAGQRAPSHLHRNTQVQGNYATQTGILHHSKFRQPPDATSTRTSQCTARMAIPTSERSLGNCNAITRGHGTCLPLTA